MTAKYIVSALVGTAAVAWACDYLIADRKIFGGKSSTSCHLKTLKLFLVLSI